MRLYRYSACCGARVYDDSDICTDCHEHCQVIVTCPDCEGSGEVEVLDRARINSTTISPIYKKEKCETCDGTGEIEE